eukprot:72046_1
MEDSFRFYLQSGQISSLIFGSIGFVACSAILMYEMKHRHRHRQHMDKDDKNSHSKKWLRRFALLSMLASTLNQFLVVADVFPFTIIPLCLYTPQLMVGLWMSRLLFVGLFQIKRLQLITSTDVQIYGESKFPMVIKALYIGAIIPSLTWLFLLYTMIVTEYGEYGCIWTWTKIGKFVHMPSVFIYLCWDGSTLMSYIFKLSQYRRTIKKSMDMTQTSDITGNEQLYNNTKKALSKIILLTIIYEIGMLGSGIFSLISFDYNPIIAAMFYFWVTIDCVCSELVVFFMQSHNNKQYKLFMYVLQRAHCLVCCRRLAEEASFGHNEDEKNIGIEIEMSEIRTKGTISSSSSEIDIKSGYQQKENHVKHSDFVQENNGKHSDFVQESVNAKL